MSSTFMLCVFLLVLLTANNCQLITNWQLSSNGFLPLSGLSSGCIISINKYNNTDSVYIFGGRTDNNNSLTTIYKWNIHHTNDTSSFKQLQTKLPSNITCDQSITYNTNNNIIYMIGITTYPLTYGTIYTFNPITNTFLSKIPSMQTNTRSSCIVMDNKNNLLYSLGGLNTNETAINELQILNIVTNKWKKKTYITPIPINIASSSCWLSLDNTQLYSFGGKSLIPLKDIYRYNIITNTWIFIGNLSKPKTGTKAIYINNYNKLLIIGGLDINNKYIGEIESFEPINEQTNLLFQSNIFMENINNYNGYLMSIYIEYVSQLYVWGVGNSYNNISHPLKTNLFTYSPTNNPISNELYVTLNPTVSPTIISEIVPNDNTDVETDYVNTTQSTKRLLNRNVTIMIGIISFVLIFCTIILILYIRIKNKTENNNEINDKVDIQYEHKIRSRIETESDPSDEIMINNISVEDIVKMVKKNSVSGNINNIIIEEKQQLKSIDLLVENDVNMVNFTCNNNRDDISSVCQSENDTIYAIKGSFDVKSNKNEILPIRTNNMANHELAEGFECDDFDFKPKKRNYNISDTLEDNSNFEIDNSCVISAMSVSEVQMEGLAIMRKQKRKKKHRKKYKYK